MRKVYKVWIEIEEYDEDTGESDTTNCQILDFAATAVFDTYDAAEAFARRLHDIGESL